MLLFILLLVSSLPDLAESPLAFHFDELKVIKAPGIKRLYIENAYFQQSLKQLYKTPNQFVQGSLSLTELVVFILKKLSAWNLKLLNFHFSSVEKERREKIRKVNHRDFYSIKKDSP